MSDWRQRLSGEDRASLKKAAMPSWTRPMLATLTDERFSSKDWIYERKLDGERCLVFRDGKGARLYSRNRKSLDATYPELVDVLEKATGNDYVADGEIVAFSSGLTSFSRLQKRIGVTDEEEARESGVRVWIYLFDLLHYDGFDLESLPLRARKRILRQELSFRDGLRFTPHRNETGEAYFDEACHKGWGGLIAKGRSARIDSFSAGPPGVQMQGAARREGPSPFTRAATPQMGPWRPARTGLAGSPALGVAVPRRATSPSSARRLDCERTREPERPSIRADLPKRADSPYLHSRSRDWLKFKCVNQQEFVIGGYTDPQGSRKGFGALLLGYYEDGDLRYAGRVGTGFDESTLERLHEALRSRARKTPAFADPPADAGGQVHWVSPTLVAEVGFTEWTDEGYLRHPRFLGLRDDKAPADVHREEASG
ncbi:ATP-dependent DNA ligase [Guyparkeria sp.]|uniref:ATP-dependent DNA ligase n=1 Tax=Guyparkeria sp. TaxID=2035736 RepID=UPI0039704A97